MSHPYFSIQRLAHRRLLIRVVAAALFSGGVYAQPPEPSAPVARLGTQTVTVQDLGAETAAKLAKIELSYEKRRADLELSRRTSTQDALSAGATGYINRRLLELEAAATHRSPEELLAAVPVAPVTAPETELAYAQYRADGDRPYAEVEPTLRAQLLHEHQEAAKRAYLARLRVKYEAQVIVEPTRLAAEATGPARGPADAAVTLILFSDFECPYCQKLMPALEETLRTYPDSVRLVYRHLPLDGLHPHAVNAARAAVCADQQGGFWPYLDALFADRRRLEPLELRKRAKAIHLDVGLFDQCVAGSKAAQTVELDSRAADELGLTSTPSLLINGRLVRGAVSAGTIAAVIDDELARRAARSIRCGD